jgi:hypothetical protein
VTAWVTLDVSLVGGIDADSDISYAVIELTPKLAREFLAKVERFKQLNGEDQSLCDLVYWDETPIFIAYGDITDALEEFWLNTLPVDARISDSSHKVTTERPPIPELDQCGQHPDLPNVEYVRMVVDESRIYWWGYQRKWEIPFETVPLDVTLLQWVVDHEVNPA